MRNDRAVSLVALTVAALLAACSSARKTSELVQATSCTSCHGGPANSSAASPFYDPAGSTTSPTARVHTAHLAAGMLCETCHVVPASTGAAGHLGVPPAPVVFDPAPSSLARKDGASPTYDPATNTCSNVYCHGPTLLGGQGGGQHVSLTWAPVDLQCTGCHAAPPPAPHPANPNCGTCHPGYDASAGTVNAATHLDGKSDYLNLSCTSCHGDASRATNPAAPPIGTHGETLVTDRAVGAHQAHLNDGALAKALACTECHVVPTDGAHATSHPQVVVFSGPVSTATAGGVYDGTARTCTTYCHGAAASPVWNAASTALTCASCHALVPASPHPQVDLSNVALTGATQCKDCHPGTVDASGNIMVASGLHVNGVVDTSFHPASWQTANGSGRMPHGLAADFHHSDGTAATPDPAYPNGLADCKSCHGANLDGGASRVSCTTCHASKGFPDWNGASGSCTFCHGSANRTGEAAKAPPVDTLGRNLPTQRGVGSHQAHVAGKAITEGVACASCHTVPTGLDHVDGAVQLALVRPGTTTATGTFDATTATCSNTYCHGNFRNGKAGNSPAWTATSGQANCSTCHASQLYASDFTDKHHSHSVSDSTYSCGKCHPVGVMPNMPLHVNGTVDLLPALQYGANRTCTTACHTAGGEGAWY